jgi:hypothetical protein
LYSSPNVVRFDYIEDDTGGARSTPGEMRDAYTILVKKLEGKRQLERLGRKHENNIKTHLKETGCYGVDWIHLAEEKDQWRDLVDTVMKHPFP